MLTAALGISSSSLYAAFGTKADLFDEAVRVYALRYSAIYDSALEEATVVEVISRLLYESVIEFTRADEGHPGCLPSSAAMADSSATLDVRAFVADLQGADEQRLRDRLEQAAADGEPSASVSPDQLADLVLTVWQGLSARAELGASRSSLTSTAGHAADLLATLVDPRRQPHTG